MKGIWIPNNEYRYRIWLQRVLSWLGYTPIASAVASILGENLMWTKPVITEIAVGLEINCYACADL